MRSLMFAHSFEAYRDLPEQLAPLRDLAYNLRWTWDHETQHLFRDTDPDLWQETERNPVELLNRLGQDRIDSLCEDAVYLTRLGQCVKSLSDYMGAETWFDSKFPGERDEKLFAYFCAEFGIHECLPIYSGGLGILAGDHLKAASDLGLPLVGVGLLYARGYFRQKLNADAWQTELYPQYDRYRLPIRLVRNDQGIPIQVNVDFPDRKVTCQIWKAIVGRVNLFLLDSNILENDPGDQSITDNLYGGDEEMRIKQETILGIGGFRALEALGQHPTVCHMNEGHAAFLSIERLRSFMQSRGCDLRTARQCVVAGNVFTTHTPVPAGFDIFQRTLLEKYVSKSVESLGMPFDHFLRYGRVVKDNTDEPFNMAILAMENSNFVNGVSKLHAAVTRSMFHARWPDYPIEEVPIGSVTNGIHTMSFLSHRMTELFDRYLDSSWRTDPSSRSAWQGVEKIPDKELWDVREDLRGDFVRFCRDHVRKTMRTGHSYPMDPQAPNRLLDPRVLTVGFARRFATYKRASLILSDPERFKSLVFHPTRPVQFVFAGKAHPRDDAGKGLIQSIVKFVQENGAEDRVVFLEDYDIHVARHLVQGVDVWLNNPRRPMEASGTSGMKVVPNGGLNCSILDGWWAEGYARGLGWAIGSGDESDSEGHQDWIDSRALYDLIEHEIAPTFYHRSDDGVPPGWVAMMKRSMAELAPTYSTLRMVREYCTRFYVPASNAYSSLSSGDLNLAKEALAWRDRVTRDWPKTKIKSVRDDAGPRTSVGTKFTITAEVDLNGLSTSDVRVQALIGQVKSSRDLVDLDLYDLVPVSAEGGTATFQGQATCSTAGHKGYIVRVVPYHEHVNVPSEIALVSWETARS